MSGAEVVLGVASAAVGFTSLSIQLVDSAQKLKSFCDAISNAPQHFDDIYQSLQTLALALEILAATSNEANKPSAPQTLLDRCITQCRMSANRIATTVEDIGIRTARYRRIRRLYLAFKDQEIQRLFVSLERDKNNLQLAALAFDAAQRRAVASQHQSDIDQLRAAVSESNSAIFDRLTCTSVAARPMVNLRDQEAAQQSKASYRYTSTQLAAPNAQTARFRVKLQIPTGWLVRTVAEVSMHSAVCGWDWKIKTYKIRPNASPIFQACMNGDVEQVKSIILRGEASLLDVAVRQYGHSHEDVNLLEMAVESSNYPDLVDWLLQQNIHKLLPPEAMYNVLEKFCGNYHYYCRLDKAWDMRNFSETLRRLLDLSPPIDLYVPDQSDLSRELKVPLCFNLPTIECWQFMSKNLLRPIETYPLINRLFLLESVTFWNYLHFIPANFNNLILIDDLVEAIEDQQVARKVLEIAGVLPLLSLLSPESHVNIGDREQTWYIWRNLAITAIKAHRRVLTDWLDYFAGYRTGLNYVFEKMMVSNIADYHSLSSAIRNLTSHVMIWVDFLRDAGISAEDYALIDYDIWQRYGWQRTLTEPFQANLTIHSLLWEGESSEIRIMCQYIYKITELELQRTPGSFPTSPWIPSSICWRPKEAEKAEGVWRSLQTKIIASRPFQIEDLLSPHHPLEHYARLIILQQDDSGIFTRLLHELPSERVSRKRSSSEPRPWSPHDDYSLTEIGSRHKHRFHGYVREAIYRHPYDGRVRLCLKSQLHWNDRRYDRLKNWCTMDSLNEYLNWPLTSHSVHEYDDISQL